jgi:hypothetical protein
VKPAGDRPWPLLAVGGGALLAGAAAAWSSLRDRELSFALAAAGLVVVGAWLALEVLHYSRTRQMDRDDTDDEEDAP